MAKLKSDDDVIVIAGKDKGKRGTVRRLLDSDRVIVSGVNMVKKAHQAKPSGRCRGRHRRARGADSGVEPGVI